MDLIWIDIHLSKLSYFTHLNFAAIWGWFPLTMIPLRSQWGRYNWSRLYVYTMVKNVVNNNMVDDIVNNMVKRMVTYMVDNMVIYDYIYIYTYVYMCVCIHIGMIAYVMITCNAGRTYCIVCTLVAMLWYIAFDIHVRMCWTTIWIAIRMWLIVW